MTNVYDIGVRYMRKVQVKEYEPCEAEVSIKAQIAEGEDYLNIGGKLMTDARTLVLDGIANKAAAKARTTGVAVSETKVEEKVVEEKPVEAKARKGRPTKAEQEAKAKAAAAAAASEFPEEETVAKEEATDDFAEEETGVISVSDLRNLFTETIRKNIGITPAIVKGWLAEYNAAGAADLAEHERDAIHKKLLASVAKITGK